MTDPYAAPAAGLAHHERHFRSGATLRDVVLGMADGLTVPFALAAGISGAAGALPDGARLVVVAGVAEIAAGAIAMGLGGYLAARSERDQYLLEQRREEDEIVQKPSHERREIIELMADYGVEEAECAPLLGALERNPRAWRDFMMRFELGLTEPSPHRARISALTIGLSYVAGGLVALGPYLVLSDLKIALRASVAVTLCALFGFGWVKGQLSAHRPLRQALETFMVGGVAAVAAYALARLAV